MIKIYCFFNIKKKEFNLILRSITKQIFQCLYSQMNFYFLRYENICIFLFCYIVIKISLKKMN